MSRFESAQETNSRKVLVNIADLRRSKRRTELEDLERHDSSDTTFNVLDWSQKVDEFGVLVWMAVLLE